MVNDFYLTITNIKIKVLAYKFRIKIWDKGSGSVIYDNQLGSSDNENPYTTIDSSIIIHRQ